MSDCVFCKIISGEIPSSKVYEDEHTCVIMDVANDVDGHMLAIPKQHIGNILDCDNGNLTYLIKTVQLISKHCVENCGFDGVNLLNASGESAGQSVPHFHIHIIPRKNGDGIDAWPVFSGAENNIDDMFARLKIKR